MHLKPELCAAILESPRVYRWNYITEYRSAFISKPSTYFELLSPKTWNGEPHVVMISGGVHSSACYLVTPDGRPGWAHAFLREGYKVVLVDWPGVGRSGYVAPEELGGDLIVDGIGQVLEEIGAPSIVMTHSMAGAFGWKLIEHRANLIQKLVAIAPAPPGNMGIRLGKLIGGDSRLKTIEMASGLLTLHLDRVMYPDKEFQRRKLVGSSRRFPNRAFESYYRSLLGISGRLVFERTNIDDAQLCVSDRNAFAGKPIAVVTGTADTDHPRAVDAAIADWLKEIGATARHLYLGDWGVEGNGHMIMLEQNSDEVANLIIQWIRSEP